MINSFTPHPIIPQYMSASGVLIPLFEGGQFDLA